MGNRYAVSDLHGHLDLFNQIKEYINEDDVVYALGDFGDRGPEPWRTLQAVLDDSQFIYLMGNHDLMLIQTIERIFNYTKDCDYAVCFDDLYHLLWNADITINGGLATVEQWFNEPNRMKYYHQLCNLPIEITIPTKDKQNLIYLSHAGYSPGWTPPPNVEDHVWDRTHFYGDWYSNGNIVVHGHTPGMSLKSFLYKDDVKEKDGYYIYNDGSKIDIDCGTAVTNQTVLLNLDTFSGKTFKTKEVVNETEN